jgi:hypothetical protein
MKIKDTNIFNTVGVCIGKQKQWFPTHSVLFPSALL